MPELPSGTVTFLFTDIERSTQTLGEIGDEAYAEVLEASICVTVVPVNPCLRNRRHAASRIRSQV